MKTAWFVLGLGLTALAFIGAFLPVMPTTVFAIGAAYCFARSSRRFELWLLNHPMLGPSVRAWRAERAIPRRAKVVALSSMAASGVIVGATAPVFVAIGTGVVLAGAALFVGTRPVPQAMMGG